MTKDSAKIPDVPVVTSHSMPDHQFLKQCRWEAFRGSGPGGQKRNKTSSAIRVTHVPTGLSAVASESRSQAQNRAKALARLRHRIALAARQAIEVDPFSMPPWLDEVAGLSGQTIRLTRISRRHERYLDIMALVLDVINALGGSVSASAARLGTSSSDLVGFLQRDEKLLAQANQMRQRFGLKPLGAKDR